MSLGDDRLGIASLCPIGGEQERSGPACFSCLLQENINFWPDGSRYLLIGDAPAFTRLHARDLDGSLAHGQDLDGRLSKKKNLSLHGASSPCPGCRTTRACTPRWGSLPYDGSHRVS